MTIRISRDPSYEINQVPKLVEFFNSILLPELFSGTMANVVACRNILKELVDDFQNAVGSRESENETEVYHCWRSPLLHSK